jgi:hypothetical protein
MALPRVGVVPSVWNSAMLVYQALLLMCYAYAHYLARLRPRLHVGIHVVLFALASLWLPIGLSGAQPSIEAQPAFWVPWFLLSSIGPLFFIVSAQAPLMQRWYALETNRGDPYPLYAASNLGSFAGLISYPLIVEPMMSLQQQSLLWTGMYVVLVLLVAICAFTVPADAVEVVPEKTSATPTWATTLMWVALAAVPSGLMLSTTTYLTRPRATSASWIRARPQPPPSLPSCSSKPSSRSLPRWPPAFSPASLPIRAASGSATPRPRASSSPPGSSSWVAISVSSAKRFFSVRS